MIRSLSQSHSREECKLANWEELSIDEKVQQLKEALYWWNVTGAPHIGRTAPVTSMLPGRVSVDSPCALLACGWKLDACRAMYVSMGRR